MPIVTTAAGCSPDEMAANDIHEWNQALATLAAGQGTISALGGACIRSR